MNISKMKRSTQIAIMANAGSTTVEKIASGTAPLTLSDSVAGNILGITIYGRSEVSSGSIVSVGDDGLTVTTTNSDSTETSTATITTGLPLRSVSDSIYDTLDNDKVIKRCAEVDLGDLTWSYVSARQGFYAPLSGVGNRTAAICSYYELTTEVAISSMPDKTFMFRLDQGYIYVKDLSYSDTATFTTAVTGVKLAYPLVTPTETLLTSAETTALAALETYDPTTVISITDNPSITVKYMGKRTARTAPKKRTNRKKKS